MSGSEYYLYDFGPFRLDTEERCLLRDGRPVSLTPKTYELLLVLVRRSGRVVEKDALMKELWLTPSSFVEEGNLTQHVFALRKALGERRGGPQHLETVPRRGYRFVGEVTEVQYEHPLLHFEKHTRTQVVTEEEELSSEEEVNPEHSPQTDLPGGADVKYDVAQAVETNERFATRTEKSRTELCLNGCCLISQSGFRLLGQSHLNASVPTESGQNRVIGQRPFDAPRLPVKSANFPF